MIVNFKKILADFDADGDGRLSRDEAPFLLKARRGTLRAQNRPSGSLRTSGRAGIVEPAIFSQAGQR